MSGGVGGVVGWEGGEMGVWVGGMEGGTLEEQSSGRVAGSSYGLALGSTRSTTKASIGRWQGCQG